MGRSTPREALMRGARRGATVTVLLLMASFALAGCAQNLQASARELASGQIAKLAGGRGNVTVPAGWTGTVSDLGAPAPMGQVQLVILRNPSETSRTSVSFYVWGEPAKWQAQLASAASEPGTTPYTLPPTALAGAARKAFWTTGPDPDNAGGRVGRLSVYLPDAKSPAMALISLATSSPVGPAAPGAAAAARLLAPFAIRSSGSK
jgi:hypothetical protein